MGDTGDQHQRGLVQLPLPLKNQIKLKSTPGGVLFCVPKIKIVGADAYIGLPHRTTCYPPVGGGVPDAPLSRTFM